MSLIAANPDRAAKVLAVLRTDTGPLDASSIAKRLGWKDPSKWGAVNVLAACNELIEQGLVERLERPRLDQPQLYRSKEPQP